MRSRPPSPPGAPTGGRRVSLGSRRRFLHVTLGGAAALVGARALGRHAPKPPPAPATPPLRPYVPDGGAPNDAGEVPELEHHADVTLAPWKYGDGSFSTETVLMFRGNPSHTFYGTGPLPDAPKLRWSYRMEDYATIKPHTKAEPILWQGTGWTGQPAKLGDYLYVGSVGRWLHCFHAATGQLMWRRRAGRMFKGSVCLFENRVYCGNVDDHLRCLDAATGEIVWELDTGHDLDSSPCVVGGRLYIAGENGHARCLDPRTGKEIWKTFIGGIGPGSLPGSNGSESSPCIDGGRYYTSTYDGVLFCLDISDGKVLWKANVMDDTDASQVTAGGLVYAASEEKASHVFAFDAETGKEVWRFDGNKEGYWSTPAVVSDGDAEKNLRLYVGGEDGNLFCLDGRSGKVLFATKVGASIWTSPCVVDGRVVFASYDHHLYFADAKSGAITWKYDLGGRCISTPCIVDGSLWVGSATGTFFCFGA